jgi:hypothetical protein
VFSALSWVVTAAALWVAGRELGRQRRDLSGLLAAVFFGTAPLAIFWARFLMLEQFVAMAGTVSVALGLLALRRSRPILWLPAGMLAASAVAAKQSALTLVLAEAVFLSGLALLRRDERGGGKAIAFWLAGIASIGVVLVTVLMAQGALSPFIRFLSGLESAALPSNIGEVASEWGAWAIAAPVLPLALAASVQLLWRRDDALVLTSLWAAAEVGALWLVPEFSFSTGGFSHYALPMLAALSLLAARGATDLIAWFQHPRTRVAAIGVLVLALATLLGWAPQLVGVVFASDYPSVDRAQEKAIGRAVELVTTEDESLLVMGNSIFYHWAARSPAARFFHYPRSLNESQLAEEASADIVRALGDPQLGAVLISRMHLEDRLPQEIVDELWRRWRPMALLPYPYQRDVFVYERKKPVAANSPVAAFEEGIELLSVTVDVYDRSAALIRLTWRTTQSQEADLTVFTHLLSRDDQLIAQHDGIPGVGFAPTQQWPVGDPIVDNHWIWLPPELPADTLTLRVGMYDAATGDRVRLRESDVDQEDSDAFTMTIELD